LFLEKLQGSLNIGDPSNVHVLESAGRGLGYRRSERGSPILWHHYTVGSTNICAPYETTEILRILDTVQYQDKCSLVTLGRFEDVIQIDD
jgi:hypothetical protein